ncbi:hypothetical protein OB236_33070 [Paenibacillus sp. WQ 127069]|uniref:DUF4179 domain-containing protein n=1 Tax=Paenibacillus baimaensis TaxID=2982185 RepID=A0ABT2USC3_9BACL|nr:hypothetical protein [Paenibacillus sp. WQ 127069]MCU6796971.1 hypothetical protein [Paenibacillus sp. WQ 127069]
MRKNLTAAPKWKTTLGSTLLSMSLVISAVPSMALADAVPVQESGTQVQTQVLTPTAAAYPLTDSIQASIKSLSISKSAEGTRIGTVVRLHNNTTQMKRVPDYEIRVQASDGSEYKVTPSASNPKSMLAMENVELTGMVTVDRQDDITLTGMSFVEVDEYVYPKQETVRLSLPITSVWNAAKPDITDPAFIKAWGDTFMVPESPSPIKFTTTSLTEQTDEKGVHTQVVTLLAENPGTASETVPGFRLDGKAGDQIYAGKRADANPIVLAAGDRKYIQYLIPTDKGIKLQSLLMMTTETFAASTGTAGAGAAGGSAGTAAATPSSTPGFDVGRLKIEVAADAVALPNTLPAYAIGTPIAFDPLNRLLDSSTQVSLMELHMHENTGSGFKSVVAKFRLQNKSDQTVTLPAFQTELVGSDGSSYAGSRQTATAANLMPNLSYVVSYSFMVPASEKGEQLGIKLLDNLTSAPYSTTIAGFQTAVQIDDVDSSVMAFYPFNVTLNDWTMSAYTNAGLPVTYSYKMKMNLTVDRVEDVVVDDNFPKFTIELVDGLGRTLGSQSVPFTGTDMLISGEQTIQISNIKSEQQEYPLTIKLYETIETPNGVAKRLVKTLQQ